MNLANDGVEARNHVPENEERDHADPEFSLITGTLRSKKTYGRSDPEDEAKTVEGIKDMTLRNQDFSLSKLESAGSKSTLGSLQDTPAHLKRDRD